MSNCQLKNLCTRSLNAGGSCRSARLNYIVSGINADSADPGSSALAEVQKNAPSELDGAALSRITLVKSHGSGIFEVQAEYEQGVPDRSANRKIGDRFWSFDTTGGRETVIHGTLLNSQAAPGTGAPPDPGTLINWNGKHGERFHVAGAPKIVPAMRESCTAVFRNSDITGAYRRTVMELTGCLNTKAFRSWEPGEVLFLGASSGLPYKNANGTLIIEVTFRFAVRCNCRELEIGDVKLGAAGGWDIPWCIVEPDVNGRTPVTRGAYLSSIYKKGDFSSLKL